MLRSTGQWGLFISLNQTFDAINHETIITFPSKEEAESGAIDLLMRSNSIYGEEVRADYDGENPKSPADALRMFHWHLDDEEVFLVCEIFEFAKEDQLSDMQCTCEDWKPPNILTAEEAAELHAKKLCPVCSLNPCRCWI